MIPFSHDTRRAALERMADRELDLLVVGGGITGCGVALDAASRGLSVGLVERDDFASGTSGRSSRYVHGGIRYLRHGEFRLVRESLRERDLLLRLAPHLVRPVRQLIPLPRLRPRAEWRLALLVYDALALGGALGWHRPVEEPEMRRAVPGLGRPARGLAYFDCVTDDARLTLEVGRTAAAFGALVANHAPVEALLGEGRVTGARVTDGMTGESFEVRARLTVNAAGVWAEHVQGLASASPRRIVPSKGVHLVFRPGAVATTTPVVVPSRAHDGRYVFVVPWGDRTYAGTTDTAHEGGLDDPEVDRHDLDYLLTAVGAAFPTVTEGDVVASWAGLRPLLPRGSGRTADLSRRHAIYGDPAGLLTVTGGKLTTYRAMAEDVVDRAMKRLGRSAPCRTGRIRIGLTGSLAFTLERATADAQALGLPPDAARRMVHRYGDDWEEAFRLIRDDPALARPAAPSTPVLEVEVALARVREMALTEEDVRVRRTRLASLGS